MGVRIMEPAFAVMPEGSNIYNKITDLFANTNDIIWIYDPAGDGVFLSRSLDAPPGTAGRNFTCSVAEFRDMIHLRDRKQFDSRFSDILNGTAQDMSVEMRISVNGGSTKWVLLRGGPVCGVLTDGDETSIVAGSITDIDEKRKKENRLSYMSYYDSLTDLPNKSMFNYRTSVAINQRRRDSGKCAVVYVGIDKFKYVNDIYGHYVGDEVLVETARLISLCMTQNELLARYSGDEFVILHRRVASLEALKSSVEKLLGNITRQVVVEGNEIKLTFSAGISVFPADGDTPEEIIKNADTAMRKAKEQGKSKYCVFDPSINTDMLMRTGMEKELGQALEREEFHLVYQPMVDVASGKVHCAEALIRWESPIFGDVPPTEFISFAEETGLILPIGSWVLRQACRACKGWSKNGGGGPGIPVSVNISSLQLKDAYFLAGLDEILESTQLPPELLQLEITESVFVDDLANASNILLKLRDRGIKVALDDFGTGYSSLNYLKCLPLDILKVDKSFIKDLKEDEVEKAIAGTIISLAHLLKLTVVAEGVETEQQYDYLRSIGCNIIQGYLISRPVDSRVLADFIRDFNNPQP